jgi:hypothetical protein
VKLLLGIPTAGSPAEPFIASIATLRLPADTAFERTIVTGNYVPAQRDLIVERALDYDADFLMMCDDDMVLPPDAVVALSDALAADPEAAIAGALYYSRDGFRPMAVDRWNAGDTRTAIIPGFDREPVIVDGVGFGCVLIRISAIRSLVPPYFPAHVFVERDAGRVRVCDEDYLFCTRLRTAGWHTLLHAGVRCGHYDRRRNRVEPQSWEPPERTAQPRIAVIENGRHALIPAREIPANTPESHVTADVSYIIVP